MNVSIWKGDEGHKLAVAASEEDRTRGPTDAPVTVVEYGDYQCPACQLAYGEVEKLLEAQGGDVLFVFRHFPLTSVHQRAMAAALAAEAAGDQGKFWQMHARLFEGRGQLDDQQIQEYAAELELDSDKFAQDVQSDEAASRIRQQRLDGARSGVNGTPTFFINGYRHEGAPTYEALSAAVAAAANHG